jgi:hypothetical protein
MPPADDMKESTAGSAWTIAARARWRGTIASNEVPSAASVLIEIRPVSSVGKSPFGTARKSQTVPTVIAASHAPAVPDNQAGWSRRGAGPRKPRSEARRAAVPTSCEERTSTSIGVGSATRRREMDH